MENIKQLYRCRGCGEEFSSYQEVKIHCREGCSQEEEERQKTLKFN
jgi:DNA-directed RNA polymerase subunit RPC12/RpoP